MTTILGVMVAVIAIWVGFAIWKNSKEQKEMFRASLELQEKLFEESTKKAEEISKKSREEAEKN